MDHVVRFLQKERDMDELKKELCRDTIVMLRYSIDGKPCGTHDFSDAIARRDSRCFFDGALFIYRNCCLCAHYNLIHTWNDVPGATIVCGSLGLGCDEPRWFEFGSPSYRTVSDFRQQHPSDWDWHVWVEDAESRVYDVVPAIWHEIVAFHKNRLHVGSAEEAVVVRGESRDSLRSRGLEYVPAPAEAQAVLLSMFRVIYDEYLEKLGCKK